MPNCAIGNCKNDNRKTKGSGIKYFRFPKNQEIAKQWIIACRRKDKINLSNACVCSVHFDEKSIEISLKHRLLDYLPRNCRTLKADAVPTLNLPGGPKIKIKDEGRSQRAIKRSRQVEVENMLKAAEAINEKSKEIINPVEYVEIKEDPELGLQLEVDKELLPPPHTELESEVSQLREKLKELETLNSDLLEELDNQHSNLLQYKAAMAKVFTQEQIQMLLRSVSGRRDFFNKKS